MSSEPQSRIRRGFADTRLGQMHYREAGQGPPVVMLHWGPASSRMLVPLLPLYAARGFRAIAVDMIGYGQSNKHDRAVSSEEHAEAVSDAMTFLSAGGGYFVGGHLPATIAVEVVLQRGDIRKLVLDGAPLLDGEETRRLLGGLYPGPWGFDAEGGHEVSFWRSSVAMLKIWDPTFEVDACTLPRVHALMIDHLESGIPNQSRITPAHEFRTRLPLVDIPILLLTADLEPLRVAHERALAFARDGRGHVFPGRHPVHDPQRATEYVAVVADFFIA